MQGEQRRIEYKVAAYKGMAFEGEDQHDPPREPLFYVPSVKDNIHGLEI
jgi:hypothetical protein